MKKHKKHKGERKERYEDSSSDKPPALKLILKVGGGSSSTPEHSDSPGPPSVIGPTGVLTGANYSVSTLEDESSTSLLGISPLDVSGEGKHKKAKKKKKKKDRDREKHEKKHKHHHKERKKRPREESSQDDISLGEESTNEVPLKKAMHSSPIPAESQVISVALQPEILASTTAPTVAASQHIVGSDSGEAVGSPSSREPRTCVLRQRQEHSPLYKLLDYLLKNLEKKDPQQFFAWPVTDNIAPGYSSIISQPMDFSTIRQKNEDNVYGTMPEFLEDFKLMCNNAMTYNQQETIYYRAAKRLLHGGIKFCSREKLRTLLPALPFLSELTAIELGFELHSPEEIQKMNEAAATAAAAEVLASVAHADSVEDNSMAVDSENESKPLQNGISDSETIRTSALEEARRDAKRKSRLQRQPLSKFEAIPDDMSPEDVLRQAKQAAHNAAEKLAHKKPYSKMGFLRTNKDGTTSLAILCGSSGVSPGTNEQAISVGALAGKLPHGTGQLAGFREDKRNIAKAVIVDNSPYLWTVKPLYYGAFGSYAPSYDSTFANLTKEESDLVYSTYGDEAGFQYAESILDFARDSDYTLRMVDELLDLLTGGEHSKTMSQLTSVRRKKPTVQDPSSSMSSGGNLKPVEIKTEDGGKIVPPTPERIDIDSLKTLTDLGIDVDFLDSLAPMNTPPTAVLLTTEAVQASLDQTSQLIGQLQKVQRDRLSQPPPPHLALITGPSESEVQLAEKITDNLTDLAKHVTPEVIAPACVVRKAMGVEMVAAVPSSKAGKADAKTQAKSAEATRDKSDKASEIGEVPDLESELREFLENTEPTLSSSPLQDEDRTIEEILSES